MATGTADGAAGATNAAATVDRAVRAATAVADGAAASTECLDEMRRKKLVFYYQPSRGARSKRSADRVMASITMLRRKVDLVLLPRDIDFVSQFWSFAQAHFGYEDDQVVWYRYVDRPGQDPTATPIALEYSKSVPATSSIDWPADLSPNVICAISALLATGIDASSIMLVPFRVSVSIIGVTNLVGIEVFGDPYESIVLKDWTHPYPPTAARELGLPVCVIPPRVAPAGDIPVPAGYRCRNRADLLEAFQILKDDVKCAVVFKPCWTSGGSGIVLNVTEEYLKTYEFPEATDPAHPNVVVLEELLRLDRNSDGSILAPVVHCLGSRLCGPVTEQLIRDGTSFDGSVCPAPGIPASIAATVSEMTLRLGAVFGYKGFWGLDYLVQDGVSYLTDINTGRPNGGHTCKLFQHVWAPGTVFKMWKQTVPFTVSVDIFAARLAAHGLLFDLAAHRGVTPLTFTPGKMGRIIAIGANLGDLDTILAAYAKVRAELIAIPEGAVEPTFVPKAAGVPDDD